MNCDDTNMDTKLHNSTLSHTRDNCILLLFSDHFVVFMFLFTLVELVSAHLNTHRNQQKVNDKKQTTAKQQQITEKQHKKLH